MREEPQWMRWQPEQMEWGEAEWRAKLVEPGRIYYLLFDGDKPIGLTGVKVKEDERGPYAYFASSYILPEYRGQKLTRYFYEARFACVRDVMRVKRIVVNHREGNEPSARAIRSYGFKETGIVPGDFVDGRYNLIYYELILE
jgi:RimJ/RimL family protein N-acetyltransferase